MYNLDEMKSMRTGYGLSYEDIQRLSGVSISSVQKIFGGIVVHPRRSTLEALSAGFEKYIHEERDRRLRIEPCDTIEADVSEKHKKRRETAYHLPSPSDIPVVAEDPYRYNSRGSSAFDKTSNSTGMMFTQSGYTYDEYAKLELPEGMRVEVIDGKLYEMSAPNVSHQAVAGEIFVLISNYIRRNKGKCITLMAPLDVRLEYDKGDMTVVQPDVVVICDRKKLENMKNVKGAPDFVVEVLSPASKKMDLYIKMSKYRESGVREYWVVDYAGNKVITYDFEGEGDIEIHTMDDTVPVRIYGGKLKIDFKAIREYLESFSEET